MACTGEENLLASEGGGGSSVGTLIVFVSEEILTDLVVEEGIRKKDGPLVCIVWLYMASRKLQ